MPHRLCSDGGCSLLEETDLKSGVPRWLNTSRRMLLEAGMTVFDHSTRGPMSRHRRTGTARAGAGTGDAALEASVNEVYGKGVL